MPLDSISPIDGRYRSHTEPLAAYWSEAGLIRYRIIVESEYLIALSESGLSGLRKLNEEEKKTIRNLYNLPTEELQIVSEIEFKGYKNIKATEHDMKSVEYFIKDRLAGTSLVDMMEWIHFALTSWDINNLAYTLMLGESLREVILPAIRNVTDEINALAGQYKNLPMLARTHGQPASPTTFGKEFKVFAARLERQLQQLQDKTILAKLNGASGNHNAHLAAFPQVDWQEFSRRFISNLGNLRNVRLEVNPWTTQIEPYDSYVEIFDTLRRINTILLGFDQDMWRYISDGWLVQKPREGEVGSSTMPHKINPIKFENSEGNLGVANALLEHFARKLPVSRLQRDLTDSTVLRDIGVALGHSLIGYRYLLNGLSRVKVDENKVREELENHPEVIAEAIQTILRREGVAMPYEKLKELTRGREVTMRDFANFIDGLAISDAVKQELKAITPANYIGLAGKF